MREGGFQPFIKRGRLLFVKRGRRPQFIVLAFIVAGGKNNEFPPWEI